VTAPILGGLGIDSSYLSAGTADEHIRAAGHAVMAERRGCALLVQPDAFGWEP
jgi:hypothetical protein